MLPAWYEQVLVGVLVDISHRVEKNKSYTLVSFCYTPGRAQGVI